jgi:sugar/nucleoside kinase (ribokinase family)
MWAVPGGGAVYAALGMALWAGAAAVVAPVGAEYPRDVFPTLDFSRSRALASTMRNWGLYEADGTRHFLSRRDSLPWDRFSSSVSDLDAGPFPACHLAPMPWDRVVALIDALRARGARAISIDLHDRVLAAVSIDAIALVLERADLFFPSRQDVEVLFPGRTPLAALRALRRHLPQMPIIGVKCGEDGVLVHAAGASEIVAVPSAAAQVVDATGAGDAFCGGFLALFARTGDVVESALHASIAASYALAAVGPHGLCGVDPTAATAQVDALRGRITRIAFADA